MNEPGKIGFEETYEVIFGQVQTTDSGTVRVRFGQKRAFLKNLITGEITPTDVYTDSEEL